MPATRRTVPLPLAVREQLYDHFEHNYRLPRQTLRFLEIVAGLNVNRHVQFVKAGTPVYRGQKPTRKAEVGFAGTSWSRSKKVADGYHTLGGREVTYAATLPAYAGLDGKKLARYVGAERQIRDDEVIALRPLQAQKVSDHIPPFQFRREASDKAVERPSRARKV
jgi:hypothetical protein